MTNLTTATREGYRAVGRGIKAYLYGWWLQLSRTVVAMAWFFVAGFVSAGVGTIEPAAGLLVGVVTFLALPVVYGYWVGGEDGENDE